MKLSFLCGALFLASLAAIAAPIEGRGLLGTGRVNVDPAGSKGAVVVFLSSKCPCSNSHVDELKDLAREYSAFRFLAVHSNGDESESQARSYFKEMALPFPVVQDDKFLLADRFGAQKTPHAFVVLPDGKVAYQGGVTNSNEYARATKKHLRNALADLQAGRDIAVPEGRALGCFIVRNK